MRSDARSPIMIDAAFVFPLTSVGITEASTTLNPSTPYTFKDGETTASDNRFSAKYIWVYRDAFKNFVLYIHRE